MVVIDLVFDILCGAEGALAGVENEGEGFVAEVVIGDGGFHFATEFDGGGGRKFWVVDVEGALGEGVDGGLVGAGADQRGEEESSTFETFCADGADGAIDEVSLLSAGRWDGGGDEDGGDVFGIFEFFGIGKSFGIDSDLAAHDLHGLGKGAGGGADIAIAGPFEPDHQTQAGQGVGFLTFQAADIAECQIVASRVIDSLRRGDGCGQGRQPAGE